jgi:hypothetical protein
VSRGVSTNRTIFDVIHTNRANDGSKQCTQVHRGVASNVPKTITVDFTVVFPHFEQHFTAVSTISPL